MKKQKPIIKGTDYYLRPRECNDYNEPDDDYEPDEIRSPSQKRIDLLKLMGRKKKITTKADGLDKDILIKDRNKKKHKSSIKHQMKK